MRVTAVRLRRARADIFLRLAGSRPIGASMRRPACTSPHTSADVLLLDFAIVELPRELLVGRVVLGDDHHAGGAAIEPMHDARAASRRRSR